MERCAGLVFVVRVVSPFSRLNKEMMSFGSMLAKLQSNYRICCVVLFGVGRRFDGICLVTITPRASETSTTAGRPLRQLQNRQLLYMHLVAPCVLASMPVGMLPNLRHPLSSTTYGLTRILSRLLSDDSRTANDAMKAESRGHWRQDAALRSGKTRRWRT